MKNLIFTILLLSSTLYGLGNYYISDAMIRDAERRYGQQAKNRLLMLVKLMNQLQNASETTKVIEVNKFFNQLRFSSDQKVWRQRDYWASRTEFLAYKATGDCEDYSIAKYFTLKQLGVPTSKLFMTYVKALKYNQAHMVLTYYRTPGSVPYVLDNINKKILPATKRTDLVPVYSFNGDKLFLAKQQGLGRKIPGGVARNKKWMQLLAKVQREK
jgi:predicted transglutaminase-like cysteine proteinase